MLARGAALRFLLTRLYDWLNVPPGALVRPKDPLRISRQAALPPQVKSARANTACAHEPRRDLHRRRLLRQSRPRRLGRDPALRRAARRSCRGGEAATTNNRMELIAAIAALEALKRPCGVDLHTDSQYRAARHHRAGSHDWKRNGWRTADKKPVKNEDLWRRLDEARRAPRDRLALGQGPCRPRDERARRRTGAGRDEAVPAAKSARRPGRRAIRLWTGGCGLCARPRGRLSSIHAIPVHPRRRSAHRQPARPRSAPRTRASPRRFAAAGRAAVERLIAETIDSGAKFLLIAGDVFDGDWRDVSTGLFFARELGKLDRAGMPEPSSSRAITTRRAECRAALPYPPSVHVFDARRGRYAAHRGAARRACTAAAFANARSPAGFRRRAIRARREGWLNIGAAAHEPRRRARPRPLRALHGRRSRTLRLRLLGARPYPRRRDRRERSLDRLSRQPAGPQPARDRRQGRDAGDRRGRPHRRRRADRARRRALGARARRRHRRSPTRRRSLARRRAPRSRRAIGAAEGRPLAVRLTLTGETPRARAAGRAPARGGELARGGCSARGYRARRGLLGREDPAGDATPPSAARRARAGRARRRGACSPRRPRTPSSSPRSRACWRASPPRLPPGAARRAARRRPARWAALARDLLAGAR